MNFFKKLFLMMGFITLLGSLFGCQAQNAKFQSLSVDSFAQFIADTAVVRLDVRTASEYAAGHIEKALNIDVLKSSFKDNALKTLPKDKTIAVYCRSGHRSKRAASILSENGYKVVDLDGGFNGWNTAGKKIVK
jgi:rhodanese-related sulfurtransferase